MAINYSAKLLFNVKDDLQLFSTVIPSIVSHVLSILGNKDNTIEDIKMIEEVSNKFSEAFTKIFLMFLNFIVLGPASNKNQLWQNPIHISRQLQIQNQFPRKCAAITISG